MQRINGEFIPSGKQNKLDKLHLLICPHFALEFQAALGKLGFPDVVLHIHERDCKDASRRADELTAFTAGLEGVSNSNICLIGSCCIAPELQQSFPGVIAHRMDSCFDLLINKSLISKYMQAGYYLMSSGWLHNSISKIDSWGFDSVSLKQFFSESAQKILYLDTGIHDEKSPSIDFVAQYIGLDYERLEIGIDYLYQYLSTIVYKWRYDKKDQTQSVRLAGLTRQVADYAMVFDQLDKIAALRSEQEIVMSIMNLFNLLFSVESEIYLPFINGIQGQPVCYPERDLPHDSRDLLAFMQEINPATDMQLRIQYASDELGIFKLSGVSFPKYLPHYKQLASFLSVVCALGISNAREYGRVQEKEHELAELNRQKDTLFSVVAHDLKGPIGGFMGLAELLCESLRSPTATDSEELSVVMYNAAKNLYDLLVNLLEWSMLQSGKISFTVQELSLAQLAKEVTNSVSSAYEEKKQELITDFDPDLKVCADWYMLSSTLRNLLFNAVKFTPIGGTISLIAKALNDDEIEITVKDNGIGIPESILQKLFQIGVNVSRKGTQNEPSTGLGLLLCKDFIAAHGSKLEVESKDGEGSRFFFRLKSSRKS